MKIVGAKPVDHCSQLCRVRLHAFQDLHEPRKPITGSGVASKLNGSSWSWFIRTRRGLFLFSAQMLRVMGTAQPTDFCMPNCIITCSACCSRFRHWAAVYYCRKGAPCCADSHDTGIACPGVAVMLDFPCLWHIFKRSSHNPASLVLTQVSAH